MDEKKHRSDSISSKQSDAGNVEIDNINQSTHKDKHSELKSSLNKNSERNVSPIFPNKKDTKPTAPHFPVRGTHNVVIETEFRPRTGSARLIPLKRMASISENENQPSQTEAEIEGTEATSRRKSSLLQEIEHLDEIVSKLQQRRSSLQTRVSDRNESPITVSAEDRKYRRSLSHIPNISIQNYDRPRRESGLSQRRSSQASTASETFDITPEMLSQLRGSRRRSMQRLMTHLPNESNQGFRSRAASLFDPRQLKAKTFAEHFSDLRHMRDRRSSLQHSEGILDNSLERVFDLRNRRKFSQTSYLEDITENAAATQGENENFDTSNLSLERNHVIESGQLANKSPQLVELKIVKVNFEKPDTANDFTQAETPLLPANDLKITTLSQQQLNTTNNNNNINSSQNHHRKSISNLSVRRRSSISHQDGAATYTQSTTYVSPDNKFIEETIETFRIVDEDSRSSISSNISDSRKHNNNNQTNINNNKMAPKIDAVSRITGEWGKWQLRTVLLIFLCKIPSSWFMACIIFTAPAPRHGEFYCKPPETIDTTNHTSWIKISHPEKEEADDQEFNIDFCNVYQDARAHAHEYFHYDSETMEPRPWENPGKNGAVIPCKSFEHKADYHSLITQFDLVCSRDILVATTQFFHLFGVLTGGILATHLLKHFSPKSVMLFGMLTQIFCGVMTGHVTSYELHVFFRCLSAVCCAQMYTAGGMIFTDITGGKYRTTCVCLFEQFWSIGVILLPAVSSFFKSWTHIYMAISFPTIILVYLWKWIPDSPRWLLQRGRLHEAREILIQCIEINGTQDSLPLDIDHQLKQQSIDLINAPAPAGWWTIWKGERAVLHMICVHLAWSIYIVIYYGMLLNIRAFSREHLEINTVIAGCSEIIGTFIGLYLILNTSIKWQAAGIFNIIAGSIAYLAWIIPSEIKGNNRVALLMLSAMVSKAAISCTLSILTTCTVELVSDEKKKICAYSTIVWARIWLLTAPFVGATVIFGQLIPQTCFASLAIIGGILTTCINSPRTIPSPSTDQLKVPNTKLNSNLPPELMPGIWTIKHHDEKYRI